MSSNANILVTGATSGLGREMAVQLAARGDHVIACGRRADRLAELSEHPRIEGRTLDLSSREAITEFCENLPALSGVILNAGITHVGHFDEGDFEMDTALIQTNVAANVQLIRALLPALKASHGSILMIASLGGLTPLPYQAVYAGTKAFMINFGLSLREELKADGVQVSVFAPGGIKTEMTDIAAMAHLEKNLAPVADVARAAIKTYDGMPAFHVPGAQNKLIALATRLLPRGFIAKQSAKIYLKDN